MNPSSLAFAIAALESLRRELIDDAFALEHQGRLDAADLAIAAAGRIAVTGHLLRRGCPCIDANAPGADLVKSSLAEVSADR